MSTMRTMEYKWDYLAGAVTTIVYGLTRLAFIWFLFAAGGLTEIAGFSVYQFYFVLGVSQLVVAMNYMMAGPASGTFQKEIYQGMLDRHILRPVNVIFFCSFRILSFGN